MKIPLIAAICLLYLHGINSLPLEQGSKCGYESCPKRKDGMINVHIVCHTHDDVGWLKTIDEYFYGDNNYIQNAGVQYILDSVVQELLDDPARKFIYVETAFFWRWWQQQEERRRDEVKQLVNNGQLEFISGGWCMNDEATTHYNDIIDQMTFGLRFLNDTFGECGRPRVAWQIDPFGHSKEYAFIMSQMNFDGIFLGRIDYEDKGTRIDSKNMEFVWKTSHSLGSPADLFTGILPNTYSPPSGFCFDQFCTDTPIMDDPKLKGYNVDSRVNEFETVVNNQAMFYATKDLIITMGNDFNYQNAHTWYKNLDKLIKHTNERQSNGSKINLFYSTPSCYLQALHKSGRNWTTKVDDFFPYASDPHAFWTGYFTSRPSVKGLVRATNNLLQVCKQLHSLSLLGSAHQSDLDNLREAQAVAQHHDAVSGTEKQLVADDYVERLQAGRDACQKGTINAAFQKLLPLSSTAKLPLQIFCNSLDISQCNITEKDVPIAVTFYNSLSQFVSHFARLPVVGNSYKVLGPNRELIQAQIVPIPDAILKFPGRNSSARNELVFKIELPPMGFGTYFIRKSNSVSVTKSLMSHIINLKGNDAAIENERLALIVDGKSGLLKEVIQVGGRIQKIKQAFYYYIGMSGDNMSPDLRASGAYIFRPNGTTPHSLSENVAVKIIKGTLVEEIHQTFTPYLSQIIRLYPGEDYAEFQWIVGHIPIEDGFGKEFVSRFDTTIQSNKIFYTDSNARQTLKRKRNFRPTFKLSETEPVSENYYPINSHIFIRGPDLEHKESMQMTVVTDRAQGGSSMRDGSIELMVHRRLLYDDAFGVGEALNEPGVDGKGLAVTGKHYLILSPVQDAAATYKNISLKASFPSIPSFSQYSGDESEYIKNFRTQFSGLQNNLPENIHILTLEQFGDETTLLRLEHRFEVNETSSDLSKPVTISLQNLFTTMQLTDIRETTLGANQFLDQTVPRFQFKTKGATSAPKREGKDFSKDYEITLNPMEIASFLIRSKPHTN